MKKLTPAQAKAVKQAFAKRKPTELKRLFAIVRAQSDTALLAAIAPKRKAPRKAAPPSLARELADTMRPLLGPAHEKVDLLIEHMTLKHRRKLDFEAAGFAQAAKKLRAHFSEAQIRAGAKAVVAQLKAQHDARETVV